MPKITPEQLIDVSLCSSDKDSCALSRLAKNMNFVLDPVNDINLLSVARAAGLTEDEARGVMDGWDVAAGRKAPLFDDIITSQDEYGAWVKVGAECWTKARAAGKAMTWKESWPLNFK